MRTYRLVSMAGGGALAALLAACGTSPTTPVASASPSMQTAPAHWEYGKVTSIDPIAGAPRSGPSGSGTIVGAVASGVVGSQPTTVLGAPGSAWPAGPTTAMPQPMYRVTVQTEGGAVRYYDVPATNELKVGDRVQLEHRVIYRSS